MIRDDDLLWDFLKPMENLGKAKMFKNKPDYETWDEYYVVTSVKACEKNCSMYDYHILYVTTHFDKPFKLIIIRYDV